MLTETDDRVLAAINLHAVFGSLPRLVELAPEARALVEGLDVPITLTIVARGVGRLRLVFADGAVHADGPARGSSARLVFASPAHLNAVVEGKAPPVPVAGPRGLRFLTRVFTPLTEVLSRYLRPSDADIADPAALEASSLLTLNVAAVAITVVGNEDRSGRFSAAQMTDGDLDIEIGDALRYRIVVADHRMRLVPATTSAPRAAFSFADLATAGDVLAGRESALACVTDGRIGMRGYIPLVDNTNRILDRVGQYLGK